MLSANCYCAFTLWIWTCAALISALAWSQLSWGFTHLLWMLNQVWSDCISHVTVINPVVLPVKLTLFVFLFAELPHGDRPGRELWESWKGAGVEPESQQLCFGLCRRHLWVLQRGGGERSTWIVVFHRGFGGVSCVRGVGKHIITWPKPCRYAELSLFEACVSQLQSLQWGPQTAEIKVKIAYSVLAVQSADQICASNSSMGRTCPWKCFLSNLVMLKFCWHLKVP